MRAAWIAAAAGVVLLAVLLARDPAAALAGWRAVFVALGAMPAGAVLLLLIARLTGADWGAALLPLAGAAWLLLPGFVPLVVQQALFVVPPPHLATWMAWPFFAGRGFIAIGLWWWLARRIARGGVSLLGAGLALVAHGIVLTIVGLDWLLGTSPSQPESAAAMVMVTIEVLAAAGAACLLRLGPAETRRDLSYLLLAAALGLAYLLFMDFLIVWYGNLPARVGWYVVRETMLWAALPSLALGLALALPIVCVGLIRGARAQAVAGGGALAGLLVGTVWIVGPPGGLALPAALAGAAVLAPLVPGLVR